MKTAPALLLVLCACGGATRGVPLVPPGDIPVLPPPLDALSPAEPPAPTPRLPPPPPPTLGPDGCPADMVVVGSFCMDRYEAPNVEGELPYALQTAYDGEAWCAARGKRLCTEQEWSRACGGPRGRAFPYGDRYRAGACNDDHPWLPVRWRALGQWPQDPALDEATHLFQADMSGARAECTSAEGVHDLTGNVAEWVRRSGATHRPGYDHVLKGCFWAGCYKTSQPTCGFVNGAHPGTFRTYEAGFRCCKARTTAVASPP